MSNRDQLTVELPPDCARWIAKQIEVGTFATPADAVRHAINETKLAELRATLSASLARGGSNSVDDVRDVVAARLAERHRPAETS